MTKSYYLRNVFWGFIPIVVLAFNWVFRPQNQYTEELMIFSVISCVLLPFAKLGIEKLMLKFTTTDFWTTGFFESDVGTNGLRAIYYLFCFVFAIPVSVIYFVGSLIKKAG